jgi:hypothetical protein
VLKRLSYFFFLKSVIILELQTTLMDELAKKLQYERASKIDQPIEATNKTHNTKTKTYPKVKNNHFPRGGKPRHMASEEKKLNQLSTWCDRHILPSHEALPCIPVSVSSFVSLAPD